MKEYKLSEEAIKEIARDVEKSVECTGKANYQLMEDCMAFNKEYQELKNQYAKTFNVEDFDDLNDDNRDNWYNEICNELESQVTDELENRNIISKYIDKGLGEYIFVKSEELGED